MIGMKTPKNEMLSHSQIETEQIVQSLNNL